LNSFVESIAGEFPGQAEEEEDDDLGSAKPFALHNRIGVNLNRQPDRGVEP
jgi:hypothetical protein